MRGRPDGDVEIVKYLDIPVPSLPGCVLLINARLDMRIEHPDCTQLAYVRLESDVYYCLRCDFRGNVSHLWPTSEAITERIATPQLQQITMWLPTV